MAVDFHEARFPSSISRGSSGGPRRRTDIVTLRSGHEERNSVWADSRREYDAGLGVQDINQLYEVISFFEARLGRLYGFRWKDWADYKSGAPNIEVQSSDQELSLLPGQTRVYQLKKRYTSYGHSYFRTIHKPVQGSVVAEVDGIPLVEEADFFVDYTTGLVYLAFEWPGTIKAGFEFDVPVRFSQDHLDISVEQFNAGSVPQINTIEVKVGSESEFNADYLTLATESWARAVDLDNAVNTEWNKLAGDI